MTIDLSDETLFGNEAAEDELEEIFASYAVERREIRDFLDTSKKIRVARAYKGEGKSAILRLVEIRLKEHSPSTILVRSTGPSLSPTLDREDSDEWVRGWKKNILRLVASEIGSRINFAFSDDAITLVEEAEVNGFKSRSFVSTVADRLKSKAVPIEKQKLQASSPEHLLKRWMQRGSEVWIIIDDIDQNFENTAAHRIKVTSFFVAVRQIANLIPEFRFRLAVRPNVWSIVKREHEALSHVEQYVVDLSWSLDDFYDLLAKRIEGYFKRAQMWEEISARLSPDLSARKRKLIGEIFEDPMPWGRERTRPPTTILYTMARHRPRWLVELCKAAAKSAVRQKHTKITFDDIDGELEEFGKRRIDDTVAEFRSQCTQIEDLLTAFVNQKEWFSTDELIRLLRDSVLQGVHPKILGVLGKPSPLEVAHFLFQIGFLTARKDFADGNYEHLMYAENPYLLSSRTNVDQGYSWEIHPVFRQALKLKNVRRNDKSYH
jgi:hypothetical protein